jgi:hypothetical protein
MSALWKQKAEQREDARDARIIAESIARRASSQREEAAKTPEQKAEEAQAKIDSAWCQSGTEEHARSPAFYAAENKRWKELYKIWDEEKRIREGGHPKVNLGTGFPPLGSAAGKK